MEFDIRRLENLTPNRGLELFFDILRDELSFDVKEDQRDRLDRAATQALLPKIVPWLTSVSAQLYPPAEISDRSYSQNLKDRQLGFLRLVESLLHRVRDPRAGISSLSPLLEKCCIDWDCDQTPLFVAAKMDFSGAYAHFIVSDLASSSHPWLPLGAISLTETESFEVPSNVLAACIVMLEMNPDFEEGIQEFQLDQVIFASVLGHINAMNPDLHDKILDHRLGSRGQISWKASQLELAKQYLGLLNACYLGQ